MAIGIVGGQADGQVHSPTHGMFVWAFRPTLISKHSAPVEVESHGLAANVNRGAMRFMEGQRGSTRTWEYINRPFNTLCLLAQYSDSKQIARV
jgi:hypothetical protein